MNIINLEKINLKEALRYMGYGNNEPDSNTKELLLKCEKELLEVIEGKFTYKVFDIKDYKLNNCKFELEGNSVKEHLKNCDKAILMCVTLSSNVDSLIRKKQIYAMAEAMMIDSMASAAVEQVCDVAENIILKDFKEYEHTWRFGLGYGDFPLEGQSLFLDVLDASKRVGVCVNDSMMLTPTKSVTCIIGLGHNLSTDNKKSCKNCTFAEYCQYRKEGTTC